MNKFLQKLAKIFLGFSMAAGVGVAVASGSGKSGVGRVDATNVTYQHVFNAKPSTGDNVTLSSVSWNITATQLGNYNSGNYAGVQLGTSKANGSITLTSSSAWGGQSGTYKDKTVITEVRLWLNLGGTSVTPTVTIGGVSATSDGTTVVKNSSAGSDWTKATKVTFTPASNGNTGVVVVNVTTVKAGYICCLEIDCEEPGGSFGTLDHIQVTTPASKTSFEVGETFSSSGLVLTGYDAATEATANTQTYSSGYSTDYDSHTFVAGDVGTGKTVTVTYSGKTTTYTIDVEAAADIVLNTSNKPYTSTSSSNTGEENVTLSGIQYHSYAAYIYNSYLSFNRNQSGAYLGNNTAFNKNVKKIVVDYNSGGSSYFTMYEGTSALAETTTISPSASGTGKITYTFSDSNPYFKFKLTTTGTYCNIVSISIYLGSAASQDTTTVLSVNPNSWTGYDGNTLTVSNFTVSCTSTKSPGYEFQGIGSGEGDNFVARVADFSSGHPTTADTRLQWKAKYPTTAGGSTYLYAYVSLNVSADYVTSVEVDGSMTNTSYPQGNAWDPTGFTVYAYYASAPSTPVDVTSSATWTYEPATTNSLETTSVTCTASFGGKSDTSSAQTVEITEKTYIGGIVDGGQYVIVCANSNAELPANVTITSEYKSVVSYSSGDENSLENCWTFTTTGVDNVWTITNYKDETLKCLSSNDGIRTSTAGTNSAEWTASLVNENITIGGKNYVGLYFQAGSDSGNRYLTYYSGNTSFRGYGTTTGQGADSAKFALIPYQVPDVLDSDLTLSGTPASLTAGSTFPGVTKAEAEYSVSGTKDVTSSVTYTLGGSAIAVDDTIPVGKVGNSVEVVVTYTDANSKSATASFNVPVNYKAVTSVTLDKASATIAKSGTVQLTATVSDEYAPQTVKWTTSSSSIATLSAATSTSGSHITVTGSSSNAGSATITAYVDENDNGSLDSGEKSATCTVTVSGDPVLNMYDESSELVTGETLNKFTGDSNFYLNVVAQNFVGEITYTWSSSNTSAVSIYEEADEMCEFAIAGSGNATISCHAVGATSGNLTVSTTIHVAVPAVTSVTWNASNISAYTNQSLTSTIVNGWTVSYEKDNGDSGTVSFGTYDLYLGSEKITSLPRAWTTADDGKTLHVEYGGISTSSVSVQITEHLNSISYSSWAKVTDISSLEAGDIIVIAENTKGTVMSNSALKAGETLASVSTTITDGEITDLPSDGARLTVGGSSGAWTLQNSSGEYLSITSLNTRHLQFVDSEVTLSISISDGEATIGNGSTRILLNASANPFRYSTYQSATSATMLLPEIYKASTVNIADSNVNAQRALLSFVNTFNTTMDCSDGGDTTNIESKWSSASSAFTSAINGLSSSDQKVFKRLVANASSVEGGDSLQDFLARYDYIIAKYKLDNDFLHSSADRAEVAKSQFILPLVNIIGENTNTVAIIVIISMVSVTAIGGYFFLRKRKENI